MAYVVMAYIVMIYIVMASTCEQHFDPQQELVERQLRIWVSCDSHTLVITRWIFK